MIGDFGGVEPFDDGTIGIKDATFLVSTRPTPHGLIVVKLSRMAHLGIDGSDLPYASQRL
jgi:hypothetical protein